MGKCETLRQIREANASKKRVMDKNKKSEVKKPAVDKKALEIAKKDKMTKLATNEKVNK